MKTTLVNAFNRAKAEFEANPLLVLTILAMLFTATARLISSISGAQNSRTWRKEVNRRVNMQSQK
jgi:hypothetical protein